MLKSVERNTGSTATMNLCSFIMALIGAFVSLWVVQPATAAQAVTGNASYDPSVLSYMCRVAGGVWSPPSAECGGCFYCLFPDGTLINCDGEGQCDVAYKKPLDNWELFGIIAKTELDLQQTPQGPPDLVPLPAPASNPPEGFCQRNNDGDLLVNVYNQGGEKAAATYTRIIFGSDAPVDYATPEIVNGTGEELVIEIPDACFDPNTLKCSFTIGVDAHNDIAESVETNNNAAGLCGPIFQ